MLTHPTPRIPQVWTDERSGVTYANGQVIGYDITAILRGGVFRVGSPTFFRPFVLMQAMLVVAFAFLTAFICYLMAELGMLTIGDGSLTELQAKISEIHNFFGGLTGFLFAYFVFTQLSDYNTIKGVHLGDFTGAAINLVFLTNRWVPGNAVGSKELAFKETVLRWIMAVYALTCYVASDTPKMAPAEALAKVVEKKYLTAKEAAAVAEAGHNVCAPLFWIPPAYESMLASDARVAKATGYVLSMRRGVGGVLTAVSSYGQFPLPLVHLMSAFVKVALLFQGLKSGVDLAMVLYIDTGTKGIQMSMIFVITIITPIFYQVMARLTKHAFASAHTPYNPQASCRSLFGAAAISLARTHLMCHRHCPLPPSFALFLFLSSPLGLAGVRAPDQQPVWVRLDRPAHASHAAWLQGLSPQHHPWQVRSEVRGRAHRHQRREATATGHSQLVAGQGGRSG